MYSISALSSFRLWRRSSFVYHCRNQSNIITVVLHNRATAAFSVSSEEFFSVMFLTTALQWRRLYKGVVSFVCWLREIIIFVVLQNCLTAAVELSYFVLCFAHDALDNDIRCLSHSRYTCTVPIMSCVSFAHDAQENEIRCLAHLRYSSVVRIMCCLLLPQEWNHRRFAQLRYNRAVRKMFCVLLPQEYNHRCFAQCVRPCV